MVAQGPRLVKVSVADNRVEHEVKFADFMKWLGIASTVGRIVK